MTLENFFTGFIGALFACVLIQMIRVMFHKDYREYTVDKDTLDEIERCLHSGAESTVNVETGVIRFNGRDGKSHLIKVGGKLNRVSFNDETVTVDYDDGGPMSEIYER